MQILHMVSYVLSRMCIAERALRLHRDRGAKTARPLWITSYLWHFVYTADFWCEPLKREKVHGDCVQMGPDLWLCWESALKSRFHRFQPAFSEKYKGIRYFSTISTLCCHSNRALMSQLHSSSYVYVYIHTYTYIFYNHYAYYKHCKCNIDPNVLWIFSRPKYL